MAPRPTLLLRLLAPLLVMGALAVPTSATAADPPTRTYTYEVRARGAVASDLEAFAAHAAATLADPRGWSMGGSLGYQRVASGGQLTLWLAEPSTMTSFSSACSASWSCRVGRNVIVNDLRWRTASPAWTRSLEDYRHYVVVHELGHWLGQGHSTCPGNGAPAPVMLQQSKSLQGCVANVWPLGGERDVVARRHGVAVLPVPVAPAGPPDVFTDVADSVHADAVRRLAAAGVVTGHADGSFRPLALLNRGQLASTLARGLGLQATGATDFSDLAGSLHAAGVRALADAGLVTGYADGRFGPQDPVLRGQVASQLARALGLDTSDASCAPPDTVDSVHAGAVCAVLRARVAQGVAGGGFAPADVVNRGQAASFLDRALTVLAAQPQPGVPADIPGT